ncbi:CAP domain containing protein [Asbolus verrucosus]|uniref:CAP domain containing protein n=1 Tax=Asbolus verrucosus TaxID=1661398 RepID=A0A482W7Y2_ASBVE|nr:CAP domain containing protein [Asbolus verrucosus]
MVFRKTMLDMHNEHRDRLASGAEEKKGFPSAANMRVLNYDLELEYIAYCYSKVAWKGHDVCRFTHLEEYTGQNVYGNSRRNDTVPLYKRSVEAWYSEIDEVKDSMGLINNFDLRSHQKATIPVGHFTQVIWSRTTHVGCTRVWIPENPFQKAYHLMIICNYGGGDGGNVRTTKIYDIGEPCSNCPSDTTCNDKYKNLCGKLEPIPEREPFKKENRGGGGGGGNGGGGGGGGGDGGGDGGNGISATTDGGNNTEGTSGVRRICISKVLPLAISIAVYCLI